MLQVIQHLLDQPPHFPVWVVGTEHPRSRPAQQPVLLQKERQEQQDVFLLFLPVVSLRGVAFSLCVLRLVYFLPERAQPHFHG